MIAALAVSLVLLATYRFAARQHSGLIEPAAESGMPDLAEVVAAAPNARADATGVAGNEPGCLSPDQVEMLPALYNDSLRYLPVSIQGEMMGRYRGLSQAYLESLAAQGDSGAMAVLGAMAELEAFGESPARAVGMLSLEDMPHYRYPRQPLDDSVREHFQRAADWYYAAALHGRLLALHKVGEMRSYVAGGAVGLGWISKEELDALPMRERNAMLPANVFQRLAFAIAPNLGEGPIGELFTGVAFESPLQQPILESLQEEFEADRVAAGLPPIVVPSSDAPPIEELLDLVCESYRPDRRATD